MITIFSFIIYGVINMVQFNLAIRDRDAVTDGLLQYLACESQGHVPGKCDRAVFETHTHPYITIASYLLLGLIPITILNFVIRWQSVKNVLGKVFKTVQ